MSQTELAWAAGFFEGEGCVILKKRNKASNRPGSLRISIGQAYDDHTMIRWANAVGYPPELIYYSLKHGLKQDGSDTPTYVITVSGNDASLIMERMRPYLSTTSPKLLKYDELWYTLDARMFAHNKESILVRS